MRATLDIADDVLQAAKERARREDKTAGEVVSELLRQALTAPSLPAPSAIREPKAVYGLKPFARRGHDMSQRAWCRGMGVVSDHAERVCAHHVTSRLSQCAVCRRDCREIARMDGAQRARVPAGRRESPRREPVRSDPFAWATTVDRRVHVVFAMKHGGRLVTFAATTSTGAVKGAKSQHLMRL